MKLFKNKCVRFNGFFLVATLPLCGVAQESSRPLASNDSHYLAQPASPNLPSLFIIGDSTVRNGNGTGNGGQWGWGDFLAPYFNTNKINVVNDALGGTSSRTFYRDRWPGVKAMMKAGDFVILQFGHNDSSPINEDKVDSHTRSRGTIRSAGTEIELVTNILTKRFEVVHSFGWYEKQFIAEARARGATPMICSMIPHNRWKNGKVVRDKESFAGWAEEAARAEIAPFLDINEIIARQYDQLGEESVKPLFIVGAGPHTSMAGAETNATCVVSALKGLKENPLAEFFSEKAQAVAPADLSQPEPKPDVSGNPSRIEADDRPVVDASKLQVEKAANDALPTLHLVGDSTVRIGGSVKGLVGWGERIKSYFDPTKINVVNEAIAGRSARTYFTEGRWGRVENELKPGDFVIIQFGHNDGGRIGDPANKHRADGKGIGDETAPDTMPDGSTELVHTFGWYMTKFVTSAKAKGATVILCAPIPHKQRWENGRDFANAAEWDKEVAQEHGALFLDLTMVITDAYKKIGKEKVESLFGDKGTHTNDDGAKFNAERVIAGLKSLPDDPLGNYLSVQGKGVQAYGSVN